MLDAAREAALFIHDRTRDDLDQDRMLALSLVKLIEIIGEAASRVSEGGRSRYSQIPWANIIAMRNRLIHAYYDVDRNILWGTVIEDLPPLVRVLEDILR
jgi:uncharacterized protein with HEPN domain